MSNEIAQTVENTGQPDSTAGLHVALWTRRPVCGPRTTVIDRLSSLRTKEALTDFSVTTWPDEVVISGRNRRSELLETVETFEAWAADQDLSLRPPFETRTASLLVGGSKEVLTTPMMLAVVYEDGELTGIYPCTDGTETWTIPDFLDALESEAEESDQVAEERSTLPVSGAEPT